MSTWLGGGTGAGASAGGGELGSTMGGGRGAGAVASRSRSWGGGAVGITSAPSFDGAEIGRRPSSTAVAVRITNRVRPPPMASHAQAGRIAQIGLVDRSGEGVGTWSSLRSMATEHRTPRSAPETSL